MSSTLPSVGAGHSLPPTVRVPAQAALSPTTPVDPGNPPEAAVEVAASAAKSEQSRRDLKETVSRLNEHLQRSGRNLLFSVDDEIDRTVITVKNSQTGQVVRQIPDESLLRVAHSIEDLKGLLHNELS